jgi:aryl-alcohol dehydrogenase-like predicted oxidoreductase
MSQRQSLTRLGKNGPDVFPIALGCMSMSGMYGASTDDEGIHTIHRAIEHGINLIDTGDFYGMGHNELLVGRAVRGRRDKVLVSVKFGAQRGPDGAWLGFDGRPAAVKTWAAYSLKRLGLEVIDIYRPARLDPAVPIEETVGAIADLVKQGYVRYLGLSEMGVDTIRRAHAVHPVVDLQIEYSLASRAPEEKIFPALAEMGISATLYGVLSRGLLSGRKPAGKGDFRAHLPRFSGDEGARNERVVARLGEFARAGGRTPAQVCVAWALAKQPSLVPLVGSRTVEQLEDVLGALRKPLSSKELVELEALLPAGAIEGPRYQATQMAHLDSER